MVHSTIQRMGSTTKPLVWSDRLTISITRLGMTLAIASSSYRPNLGIFKQRHYQMAFMLYVMTRKGVVTEPDVLRTLTPLLIGTLLVAVPLYWMRSAWTLPQMIGLLLLSYTLFVVLLTVLAGGREFVRMLRNLVERAGHPQNVSDANGWPSHP